MHFKISRLVGDQRIGRGVRFIEAITGKFFHQVENQMRFFARHLIFFRAFEENFTMRRHLFDFFLAHRPPQQIGAAQRITADHLRDLHHLLLVNHDAAGFAEDAFHARIKVLHRLSSVLALNVVGDQLHRAGTIKRHQRDQIFQLARMRAHQTLAHPARFKLEHGGGIPFAQQAVGCRIIERNVLERHRGAGIEFFDMRQRPIEHGQCRQPQKVELDQPRRLDIVFIELRHGNVRSRLNIKRAKIGELARRNQHTAGVHADVAHQAFERIGELQ